MFFGGDFQRISQVSLHQNFQYSYVPINSNGNIKQIIKLDFCKLPSHVQNHEKLCIQYA